MKKNKRKELTPADFGISFKGKSLKEFNDFFIKEIVSTSSKTFREYLPIYAAAFGSIAAGDAAILSAVADGEKVHASVKIGSHIRAS